MSEHELARVSAHDLQLAHFPRRERFDLFDRLVFGRALLFDRQRERLADKRVFLRVDEINARKREARSVARAEFLKSQISSVRRKPDKLEIRIISGKKLRG